ncbi:MAG: putative LPS assembly protein LptD [Bacteroidetes bacterium]|nr:putative LPS assembly protein LptD [Bacteroidota bacterium]
MLTNLLTRLYCLSLCFWLIVLSIHPQEIKAQDTISQVQDIRITASDTASRIDSGEIKTTVKKDKNKGKLEAKVEYSAEDSIRFEVKNQKVYLFNQAQIKYQDIQLKADSVEIDFTKHDMFAVGVPDSTGTIKGSPEFSDGNQSFKSKILHYNYTSKKGYIQGVLTKQDEGYLHGIVVKKMENNVTYISDGSYTTCDLPENPHFEFKFNKGKVIPGKRVITGPAYLMIAGVPTPLAIPFGFFPNRSGRHSGILIPAYGESNNRGFFFTDGGFYWGISDKMELYLKGDIYTRGSWGIKPALNYNSRYHYRGNVKVAYSVNLTGSQDSPDYTRNTDFLIQWYHAQDPKARPYGNFSANVNIQSQKYYTNNLVQNAENYLTNTFQSNITYTTSFANMVQMNLNINHTQNTQTKDITITFPELALSVNQIYPFRRKVTLGKLRWYENISIKYNLYAKNTYQTKDTLLFKNGWEKHLKNGLQHTIPISTTIKVLKNLNWTNSVNFNDRMYLQTIRKRFVPSSKADVDSLVIDTVNRFANAIDGSFSSSVNTRIYGMFLFKKGPVVGIRHMMTPSVSFSYVPNFGAASYGYYKHVENDTNKLRPLAPYSIFEDGIYSGPPSRKSGAIGFSLSNNLEMKVKNEKDTITGTRKITLIDNFIIATSYDLAKDSVRWSPITLSGYTTLFKYLKVSYSSSWDMYAVDTNGYRTNKTEWEAHHRLLRLDNRSWNLSLDYTLSSKAGKKTTTAKGSPEEKQDILVNPENYIDFDIPWSFRIGYSFNDIRNRSNLAKPRTESLVQTIHLDGSLNLSPKWKINLSTGYDIVHHQLSYTNIRVDRDLHCWEMHFNWTPKGGQQQWSFSINVKASILQDLKLDKKKDFRDFSN